jgi:diadenosine tetraphosphate (Ap4A) HIT family hydrolase
MNNSIWQNDLIYLEVENSPNPWLKIFTHRKVKEFSSCTNQEKTQIWQTLDTIEKSMLDYYNPAKINIASFGNMLPQVHFHITARFKEDAYFPNPMWGEKLREANLGLPSFEVFLANTLKELDKT